MVHRSYHPDEEFFGFKIRRRVRFYDEKIIKQELSDPYRIPKNPKVVVDCGGHIGITSLMCAKMGARVITFEPYSDNFEVLKYNIEINGFKDKVQCIQKGVGKPNKQTKLYIHPSNSGAVCTYPGINKLDEKCEYEIVEIISIHDVFKDYNIDHCDMLKLDCEGSEKDIIRDLDDDLANKIDQISLEFHDKSKIKELIDILSRWYIPENTKRYEWVFRKK